MVLERSLQNLNVKVVKGLTGHIADVLVKRDDLDRGVLNIEDVLSWTKKQPPSIIFPAEHNQFRLRYLTQHHDGDITSGITEALEGDFQIVDVTAGQVYTQPPISSSMTKLKVHRRCPSDEATMGDRRHKFPHIKPRQPRQAAPSTTAEVRTTFGKAAVISAPTNNIVEPGPNAEAGHAATDDEKEARPAKTADECVKPVKSPNAEAEHAATHTKKDARAAKTADEECGGPPEGESASLRFLRLRILSDLILSLAPRRQCCCRF